MMTRRWIAVWLGVGVGSACGVPGEHSDRREDVVSDEATAAGEAVAPWEIALGPLAQRAYVKASNTGAGDHFGYSVALSADGSTLAVGAPYEDSGATCIDGSQADQSAEDAGAVYVFTRRGRMWVQQAYVKASNTGAGDHFGYSVALSADGSTLAVGARYEDSGATGIDGDQADSSVPYAGAVYVFARRGVKWRQEAYVKASNTGTDEAFGSSVALSADGSTLAVGAPHEDSGASGIDGNQVDESVQSAGAAYVFTRGGTTWSQQAYVKASNPDVYSLFGYSVALSSDGSILAVGAPFEDSAATGIDGDQADRSALYAGAAYVFARSGMAWSQQAYVKASNTDADDLFGYGVALSADGATLAVSGVFEDGAATGVGGDQTSDAIWGSGAVYVFARGGTAWSQQAYVKASNPDALATFGHGVALSADGSILLVGAVGEASAATGIDGNQVDRSAGYSGAGYLLARSGTTWSQQAYVKASNPDMFDQLGFSVALSANGSTLAMGAPYEDSAATGIGGDHADDSALDAGAVFVFDRRR